MSIHQIRWTATAAGAASTKFSVLAYCTLLLCRPLRTTNELYLSPVNPILGRSAGQLLPTPLSVRPGQRFGKRKWKWRYCRPASERGTWKTQLSDNWNGNLSVHGTDISFDSHRFGQIKILRVFTFCSPPPPPPSFTTHFLFRVILLE